MCFYRRFQIFVIPIIFSQLDFKEFERFDKTIVSAWNEALAVTTDLLTQFIWFALPGFEPSTLGSVSSNPAFYHFIPLYTPMDDTYWDSQGKTWKKYGKLAT